VQDNREVRMDKGWWYPLIGMAVSVVVLFAGVQAVLP
jgi:hypothetical protein